MRETRRKWSDLSCRIIIKKRAIKKGMLGMYFEKWVDIYGPWMKGMG